MSLINDAIKRAGQTPATPPNPVRTTAGMRPIEYQRPSRFPWLIVIAILTPVFALAVWFIAKGWELSKTSQVPASELTANARATAAVPALTPDPALVGFQVPQTFVTASNAPVVAQAPTAPAAPLKP